MGYSDDKNFAFKDSIQNDKRKTPTNEATSCVPVSRRELRRAIDTHYCSVELQQELFGDSRVTSTIPLEGGREFFPSSRVKLDASGHQPRRIDARTFDQGMVVT